MNLADIVFNAGVVGCGGAGFPTHVKYKSEAEYFLINGAECEPLLRTDRFLMIEFAEKLVKATYDIGTSLNAKRSIIALKKSYSKEISALETAAYKLELPVEIFRLDNFYPAGDEQTMIYEVLGITVPPAGIPINVGVVVSNVATALAVEDALNGIAFTHRHLTVTGHVKTPVVVDAPIGTLLKECIAISNPELEEPYNIIIGGPLMGEIISSGDLENRVVTKTTSGLIVLPESSHIVGKTDITVGHMVNRAKSACIQCEYCTQMCPRYLIGHPLHPHLMMRLLAAEGSIEKAADNQLAKEAILCCECGICEDYACPMDLQPMRVNKLLKAELKNRGERYDLTEQKIQPHSQREYRKIPPRSILARLGGIKGYDNPVPPLAEVAPDLVSIPLSQHIGAPAQPQVKPGDKVDIGQLIGKCPDGALGANIHASISGEVTAVSDSVIIERRG